jgi:hypothetical protein
VRAATVAIALAVSCALAGAQPVQEAAPFVDGVRSIAAPGVPGPIVVFGERAFPVVATQDGGVAVAAAAWGQGRVAAFGHTGYLEAPALTGDDDTALLMRRLLAWAARGEVGDERLSVAVAERGRELVAALGDERFVLSPGPWRNLIARTPGERPRVLVIGSHSLSSEEDRQLVRGFVHSGGGLITSGLAWGWLQLNPGKTVDEHPGSLLLRDAGLAFADGTLSKDGAGFAVGAPPDLSSHAGMALSLLTQGQATKQQTERAADAVRHALRALPAGTSPLHTQLDEALRDRAGEFDTLYRAMHDKPLRAADHPLAILAIERFVAEEFDAPVDRVRAHPASAGFPGEVPADAPRTEQEVVVDVSMPGWRCTGLYAPAGEVVEIEFLGGAAPAGLVVQVGAHLDPASRPPLRRVPRMVRRFDIGGERTARVASAVGGLIYLDVPKPHESVPVSGTELRLRVRGAASAPHFVLGTTTDEAWRASVRNSPAPWGEIESREIALTVPAALLREIDSPTALMEKWDEIVRSQAELEPRRLNGLGDRQARYVPDISVSWGYMYAPADKPLTIPLSAAKTLVNLETLSTNADGDCWGLYHELGHWHQNSMWTFSGTGEVTVNIFTLYTIDKVCGIPSERARGDTFTPGAMLRTMRRHHAMGAPFSKWQADPFLALTMYVQVQQAFGWEVYRDVFAAYRALPESERPRSEEQKRDQWMARLSERCGRNLAPFFAAWGVPVSAKATQQTAHLPEWMPEGWTDAANDVR